MNLQLSKKSIRFLETLDAKQYRQVARKIFSLLRNPAPADSKELKGFPFRRVDVGEYRIVYRVEEDLVKIALVGKRNDEDVYKKLKRRK